MKWECSDGGTPFLIIHMMEDIWNFGHALIYIMDR